MKGHCVTALDVISATVWTWPDSNAVPVSASRADFSVSPGVASSRRLALRRRSLGSVSAVLTRVVAAALRDVVDESHRRGGRLGNRFTVSTEALELKSNSFTDKRVHLRATRPLRRIPADQRRTPRRSFGRSSGRCLTADPGRTLPEGT